MELRKKIRALIIAPAESYYSDEVEISLNQIISIIRQHDKKGSIKAVRFAKFGIGGSDYMNGAKAHAIEAIKAIEDYYGADK